MSSAIKTTWTSCKHLLCTFHLFKNFYENIHPHFVQKTEIWTTACKKWWTLCKSSDSTLQESFEADWELFSQYIIKNGNFSSEKTALAKKQWLERMGRKAHQWAACFTWGSTTFGIHSTQRAEAIHSVIHSFCSKHRTIVDLTRDLEQMAHHQQQKRETESLRVKLGQFLGPRMLIFPPAASLAKKLTPHAADMVESQAAQIPLYCQCDAKTLSKFISGLL
jgi:hypothetical protein